LHALHDALHLLELLEQAIDVLNLHARACGNAPPARAIDDAGVAPLARGHGVDDRDLPPQLPVALVRRERALPGHRSGQLVEKRPDTTHFLQLLELALQVGHVEALALDDLVRNALRLGMIDLGVHLLDEADDIAPAEDAGGHALGVGGLERPSLAADPDEHDRHAGDLPYRERRAAPCIAVGLGED